MCNICGKLEHSIWDVVPGEYIPRHEIITILKGDLTFGIGLAMCEKLSDYDGSAILSLDEIAKRYGGIGHSLYVVGTSGLRGEIFVLGHIDHKTWMKFADTAGYA